MQKTCNDYLTASQLESGFGNGGVNIYDIFADVCGPDREVAVVRQFARVLGTPSAKAGTNSVVSTASLAAVVSLPTPGKHRPDALAILDDCTWQHAMTAHAG